MSSVIQRRKQYDVDERPDWLRQLSLHPVIENIYLNRGISSPSALDCGVSNLANYADLKGIEAAVQLLGHALTQQQKIMIVGDFDADGATSTALCLLALTEMGAKNVDHLVPNRFEFGYGLTPPLVDIAAERGAQLIVTVDNGIACFAGVERAKQLGLNVLITDHHLAAEKLPSADAIVNPNQPGCEFSSKSLAGVGVAFYVLLGLRSHLHQQGWFEQQQIRVPNLANYLDLVAVGTVADVVPLDTNNRVLVHQGLQRIRAGKCRPGIKAMLEVANREAERLTSTDLGFVIGPRLNAAGRLDDMSLGIECLLAQSEVNARSLAVELDRLNQERKHIESGMQTEALAKVKDLDFDSQSLPNGLVIYQQDFHAGVVGIVAGRIKDKYQRPTIVFAEESDQTLKGSARSVQGVHIRDALERVHNLNPELIIKFGGHAMAAGLSIHKDQLERFNAQFNQTLNEWQSIINQTHVIQSDGELDDECLSISFSNQLRTHGPWGQAFEEPVFDGVFLVVQQRIVGEKHLKLVLQSQGGQLIDGIAFNVDTQLWPNATIDSIQIAYKLDVNHFRGKASVQLIIESLAPAQNAMSE